MSRVIHFQVYSLHQQTMLVAAYCILKLRNNATYLLGSVETLKMTIRFYSRTFYCNRRMPLISYVNKRSLNNSTLIPTFISTCYFSNNSTNQIFPSFFFLHFSRHFLSYTTTNNETKSCKGGRLKYRCTPIIFRLVHRGIRLAVWV